MSPEATILVSEIFGPTIQGEGPYTGHPAAFLRTAVCNQACVWCDTPYTWDWTRYDRTVEIHPMTAFEVASEVENHLPQATPWNRQLLVVSGGEPMLQQDRLVQALNILSRDVMVQVETAGTITPREGFDLRVHLYVVSPKLAHSGNPVEKRYKPEALQALSHTHRAMWKFVCQQPSDVLEAEVIVRTLGLEGPVYVMAEGTTPRRLAEVERTLVEPVLQLGWRLTPRFHVDIWNAARGH